MCKMMVPRICYMCGSVVQEANSSQEFVFFFPFYVCVCVSLFCIDVTHSARDIGGLLSFSALFT